VTLHPLTRFNQLLQRCAYPGLAFEVCLEGGPGASVYFLRVASAAGTCNVTGEPWVWKGRKWRLSRHMTDGEVVWTAFKAILTALEHEARELFKFDGVAVADSHVDIHKLVALMKDPESIAERPHGPATS
jgi:hypothetical protein